jgi:hypothetical protein
MAVQVENDVTTVPFIRRGPALTKEAATVVQDAGRGTADMVQYTLMVYDPATSKWNSFTDETATDGTQFPKGILLKTLAAADIVAGDVEDVPILVGDAVIDQNQLVIENSKTLATVVNVPANLNQSVEDLLRWVNIYTEDTVDISSYET